MAIEFNIYPWWKIHLSTCVDWLLMWNMLRFLRLKNNLGKMNVDINSITLHEGNVNIKFLTFLL